MKIELDVQTSTIILSALKQSFMRYARIITVDEKDTKDLPYLKTLLYGMKNFRDTIDLFVDELEKQYGMTGSFINFRVPGYVLKQAEDSIAEKENSDA